MSQLKKLAKEYTVLMAQREQRQKLWQKTAKKQLQAILEELLDGVELDCYCGVNDEKINNETVYVLMNDVPSGISYNPKHSMNMEEGHSGPIIKHGGSLNFSLMHNANILCWLSYPFIDDVIAPSDFKLLATLEIDNLNKDIIEDKLCLFLEEMLAWEQSFARRESSIGFKVATAKQGGGEGKG